MSEIFSNDAAEEWTGVYLELGFQGIEIALDSAISFGFGGFDQYAAALAAAALIHDALKGVPVYTPENVFSNHLEIKKSLSNRVLKLACERVIKASRNSELMDYYKSRGTLDQWTKELDAIFWGLTSAQSSSR